jgi:hypothetical protein
VIREFSLHRNVEFKLWWGWLTLYRGGGERLRGREVTQHRREPGFNEEAGSVICAGDRKVGTDHEG